MLRASKMVSVLDSANVEDFVGLGFVFSGIGSL